MRKISLISFFFILYVFGNAQRDVDFSSLESDFNKLLELRDAAGFAVAVVDKDGIVYAKGFGYRDLENKIPVDEETLFAIGSCTKAFTAAILGQLEDEGKLSLNDSPIKYIPELKFNNDVLNSEVTIHDMMTHRTGLPRHDLSWYLFPDKDKMELIKRIEFHEASAPVRSVWQYNNFMYLAQGVITEKITGKSWEDNVEERIFKELEMTDSNLDLESWKSQENRSIGYGVKDGTIDRLEYYDIAGMSPAGSINSNVIDMAKWVQCWINNGQYNDKNILPKGYRNQAITGLMAMPGGTPGSENPDLHLRSYGYGWMVSSYRGRYRVEHGGNIDGFSASTSFFPSDSLGIIVLVNQNGSSLPGTIRNMLVDKALGLKDRIWDKRLEEGKPETNEEEVVEDVGKIEGANPTWGIDVFSGNYSSPGYGKFEIFNQGDDLYLVANDTIQLIHYHYDIFYPGLIDEEGSVDSTSFASLKFQFLQDLDGSIKGVESMLQGGVDPIFFRKEIMEKEVTGEELEAYIGTYEMGPMTADFYSKEDEILYLFVEGQPEYKLIATDEDKFSLESLPGFHVQFIREGNTINAVNFIQPNGTFKATRKE